MAWKSMARNPGTFGDIAYGSCGPKLADRTVPRRWEGVAQIFSPPGRRAFVLIGHVSEQRTQVVYFSSSVCSLVTSLSSCQMRDLLSQYIWHSVWITAFLASSCQSFLLGVPSAQSQILILRIFLHRMSRRVLSWYVSQAPTSRVERKRSEPLGTWNMPTSFLILTRCKEELIYIMSLE